MAFERTSFGRGVRRANITYLSRKEDFKRGLGRINTTLRSPEFRAKKESLKAKTRTGLAASNRFFGSMNRSIGEVVEVERRPYSFNTRLANKGWYNRPIPKKKKRR